MSFTLAKRQSQNQGYEEFLAEGILPLRMMQIPAGRFLMGSPEDEVDRFKSEGPQHKVAVSQFFMAQYPVTQAQWKVVAAMPQVNRKIEAESSRFKEALNPVERVSWYEAVEFCDRLTIYTDRHYRLPTEAEWEYACRAGTTTPFHFGETINTDLANYRGTDWEEGDGSGVYGNGPTGEYRGKTTPIDQFEGANAFGLSDMHGNVFEWCQDHWHDNYTGAPTDGSAWDDQEENSNRVIRGGSWDYLPRWCRSAARFKFTPGGRYYDVGFRVVCSAPRIPQT